MPVSGLFNSWATPATSSPIAASFSVRPRWSATFCSSVRFLTPMTRPTMLSVASRMWERVTAAGNSVPSFLRCTCSPVQSGLSSCMAGAAFPLSCVRREYEHAEPPIAGDKRDRYRRLGRNAIRVVRLLAEILDESRLLFCPRGAHGAALDGSDDTLHRGAATVGGNTRYGVAIAGDDANGFTA